MHRFIKVGNIFQLKHKYSEQDFRQGVIFLLLANHVYSEQDL